MSAQQYKLDLGMEPTIWESLGFDDMQSTMSWFNDEDYEQWRENIHIETYDAWSECWKNALYVIENQNEHSRSEVALAESVFKLMCTCSMVPIVEGRFNGGIARNQLD